jgi:hypothetical protein
MVAAGVSLGTTLFLLTGAVSAPKEKKSTLSRGGGVLRGDVVSTFQTSFLSVPSKKTKRPGSEEGAFVCLCVCMIHVFVRVVRTSTCECICVI